MVSRNKGTVYLAFFFNFTETYLLNFCQRKSFINMRKYVVMLHLLNAEEALELLDIHIYIYIQS